MENPTLNISELERALKEAGIKHDSWVGGWVDSEDDSHPKNELKLNDGITLSLHDGGTPDSYASIESQQYPIIGLADAIATLIEEAYSLRVNKTRNRDESPMHYFHTMAHEPEGVVRAVRDMQAAQSDYEFAIKKQEEFVRTLLPWKK